jgi:hypothetical protein
MPEEQLTELERFAAALATLGDDVVLSHRSAADLWGLWTPHFDGIEVTTPAGDRGSAYTTSVQRRVVVPHRRILAAEEVTTRHGLPVTTLPRTWLDLAGQLDVHDLVAAGDSILRTGLTTDDLLIASARVHRVRGLPRARQAGPLLDRKSRSRPESRIRAQLLLAGLPRPKVNEPVFDDDGGWLAEPDLHYPEAKLAIEYNGADHADFDRMGKDSVRLLALQRAGWTVRIYTAVHAFRRLDEVSADVRTILSARAPELLTLRYRQRAAG